MEGLGGQLCFSPDGKHLAVPGDRASLDLWEVESGQRRQIPLPNMLTAFGLAFSPDWHTLAASGAEYDFQARGRSTGPGLTKAGVIDLIVVKSGRLPRVLKSPSLSGACLLLRRASAASRHLVWLLALSGLLVLPLLGIFRPRHLVLMRPARLTPAVSHSALVPGSAPVPASRRESRLAGVSTSPQPVSSPTSPQEPVPDTAQVLARLPEDAVPWKSGVWAVYVITVWLGGTLLVGARIVFGLRGIRLLERASDPLLEGSLVQQAEEAQRALGCRRAVRLRLARAEVGVVVPLTWGWRSPVVLLPSDEQAWSSDRRKMILLHEIGHTGRGDWTALLVAQAACALYWFHPLAWLAARSLRAEGERATDDRVLATGVRAGDYGECLLEFVRLLSAAQRRPEMKWTLAMACPSTLEKRLCALLDARRSRKAVSRLHLLTGAVATTAVLLSAVRLGAVESAFVGDTATTPARAALGSSRQSQRDVEALRKAANRTVRSGPGVVVQLRDNPRRDVFKDGSTLESKQQAFTYSAQTIRKAEKDRGSLLRKGDLRLWGVPGRPARITSPNLSLSGVLIQLGTQHRNIVAACRGSEPVKIKGEITPTKGGLPMRFEATCEAATFDGTKEIWYLAGDVTGFYETAHGRKPLNGEVVTISRMERRTRISVTQETTDLVGGNAGE
jgi:beta-lactamase regulating signal transducer with metallopeptidase domain